MKKKVLAALKCVGILWLLWLMIGLLIPTWTPDIEGENSISELEKVEINGTKIEVMIRGKDKDNPVIIFVHGGPCCSEIPYVRKYQSELENNFTIIHYDQRGSGKSYVFGEDYSDVTAAVHTSDLIKLTEFIEAYLNQEQVILVGHSYGTYIATMAAAQRPELYEAYVGIGQMSDTVESELDGLEKCIAEAEKAGIKDDVSYLKSLELSVEKGESITPRKYVRRYGFAARKIDDNADYLKGFLFGTEYNLMDAVRFYTASVKYQDALIAEALNNPITDIVTEINIPVYFVMGKYDGMTSPEAAEDYLNCLTGKGDKRFVLFEESAHYPQFEESENFYQWMYNNLYHRPH